MVSSLPGLNDLITLPFVVVTQTSHERCEITTQNQSHVKQTLAAFFLFPYYLFPFHTLIRCAIYRPAKMIIATEQSMVFNLYREHLSKIPLPIIKKRRAL